MCGSPTGCSTLTTRWWRLLYAVDVVWSQATQVEARDFMRWMRIADKSIRPHWRHKDNPEAGGRTLRRAA